MAVIKLESLVLRGVRVLKDVAGMKRIGSGAATQPIPAVSFPIHESGPQVDSDSLRQVLNPAVKRAGRSGRSLESPRSAACLTAAAQACPRAWRERPLGHRKGQFGLTLPADRYCRPALLAGTFAASTREEQVG